MIANVSLRSIGILLIFVAVPVVVALILLGSLDRFAFVGTLIAALREASREWWAVPAFVALYAAFALLLFPLAPLSAAAALAWGWKVGGAIELVACTLAAVPPFLLARRGFVPRLKLSYDTQSFSLLLLRLVPVVPFVALNYIAGLGRFRVRDYVLTTFIGSIPSVFLFAWFVDTMGAAAMGRATQLRVLAACVAVALVAVIGRLVALRAGRKAPPQDGGDRRSAEPALPPE